jgi:hypothetical protein
MFFPALLIIDLSLDPDKRLSVGWNIGIDSVRTFLYNVVTAVIAGVFAKRSDWDFDQNLLR